MSKSKHMFLITSTMSIFVLSCSAALQASQLKQVNNPNDTISASGSGSAPIVLAQRREGGGREGGDGPSQSDRGAHNDRRNGDAGRSGGDRHERRSTTRDHNDGRTQHRERRAGEREGGNRGKDGPRVQIAPRWRSYGHRGRRYRGNRPGYYFWAPWVGTYVYFGTYDACYSSCRTQCLDDGYSRPFCADYCSDLCAW